jgi:hypothetical protein
MDWLERKARRKAIREQFAAARNAGLAKRHAAKLHRKEEAMATRRPEPIDEDRERERGKVAKETEAQRCLRLADDGLRVASLNLRRLRDITPARDALKLVRQAQNLLMDAEEDAD